jgi:hypothetical protein
MVNVLIVVCTLHTSAEREDDDKNDALNLSINRQ